ncbi:MAG: hypothetical protein H5T86_08865 [Armatimonadetes bacterium]|nr:hypothetical protein [Armatimonadota bacterium]
MSFRDVHLYRMYRQQPNNLFPISRLMTHGITQGEKNMLGGPDEPIREWADYVMMYFGRGVQMKELYLSPGRMRPDMWKAVGMALRWAQRRADILARTTMVGGDPAKGEAYGFVRWLGDRGIWVLRNPSLDEQTVSVPVDQTTGYLGKQRKLYAAVVYPFVSPLADPVEPGKAYLIQAPPASVVVVEVRQEPWGRSVMPPSMRVQASSSKMESGGELVITANATIWAKQAHQPRLYVTLRGGAVGPCKIECQCADERSQTVSGTGWQMTMMPLKDLPSDLQVRIKLPTGERKPFSMQPGEVEAWLVAELPCDTAHLLNPPDDLPWAIADGFRRRSVLLVRRRMEPSGTRVGVADDELHHATAAKLRIDVFGVNAGEYADKWIILNGEKLCRVPFNDQSRLDEWETKIIDLTSDQIKLLKRENEVVLTNEPGDCYKFRNVALAVQLPDGRWAETNWAGEVHCSVAGWLYSEGALFQNAKSRPITLRFSEP